MTASAVLFLAMVALVLLLLAPWPALAAFLASVTSVILVLAMLTWLAKSLVARFRRRGNQA